MMHARQRAISEQLEASDPSFSAFVEASAGSGKTKLLTDRVLRLMLAGAAPGRIQCLTFTKAAAAEMSLRLQQRLGEWATADALTLHRDLVALAVDPGEAMQAKARELFAEVLDLPGGMRIGTIHAFCQSLLRRFPLEAAISPHFQLVEEAEARVEMQEARERVLGDAAPGALAKLAGLVNAQGFGELVDALDRRRDRVSALLGLPDVGIAAAVRRTLGAEAGSEAELLAAAVAWPGEGEVAAALRHGLAHGTDGVRRHTGGMLDWLARPASERAAHWPEWVAALLTEKGEPRKPERCFAGKALAARIPTLLPVMAAEQARVLALQERLRVARVAEVTTALLLLARPMLLAYAERKERRALLDYTDLIGRTATLLRDPGAAWVLYKLDGGIDHILLDEVQDTAPEQWQIAHRLTEEFFAGIGARGDAGGPARTFFAVGDPKQSIYSFQGADPVEFIRSRDAMAERVQGSGQRWRDVTLDVSFRSTRPVLALVDAVFADTQTREGVADDGGLRHFADRAGDAGRVELWPLAPPPEKQAVAPWTVPDRYLAQISGAQRLADALAVWIADEIRRGTVVPSRKRPLEAGDVLVLVQRRGPFADRLVRALKTRAVPVAGLDRLVLTEQAAVQDVLAACDAVLLPQDDLAVACVLTSPLGGLSDDSLMALALGRERRLWDALRDRAGERPEWGRAWDFLAALQARADHVTPHQLIAEALGPLGGRARLLARLGAEAAEPLDELLSAALAYTTLYPPSLQGFVHWLRRSGAVVKREPGGSGGAVRIMTAHGAKGLQAPLVILPDTTGLPPDEEKLDWAADPATGMAVPLWAPRKEFCCAPIERARAAERTRQMRENNRLLYVALTRAEDRLVVCGWSSRQKLDEASWYAKVARGLTELEPLVEPFAAGWPGEILAYEAPQLGDLAASAPTPADGMRPLPAWAGHPGDWRPAPPPPEPRLPQPLAPSRPEGASFGPVPRAASPLQEGGRAERLRRGTLVHELLQHLPALPPDRRERAARAHLARHGLDPDAVEALAGQALAVLRDPALAPLFGPHGRAEQPLTGLVGGVVISGKVDRMAVLPDQVLLADYKTGRAAPAEAAATPVLYLRQLAAYRAVLQALYPARPVRCALIWTEGAVVMPLPPALLDAHAPSA